MTRLTRRTMLGAAAAIPALSILPGTLVTQAQASTLIHAGDLPEGRRFARRAWEAGRASTPLAGDPIRQAMAILAERPRALWGVTRFSDSLLFEEAARELGYVPLAVIRHDASGQCHARCRAEAESIATLARQARQVWPERFAELATGSALSAPTHDAGRRGVATSWVLVPRPRRTAG